MEKLRLPSKYKKEDGSRGQNVIRATDKTYDIIEELRIETGMSKTRLLEKLVEFAYNHVELY